MPDGGFISGIESITDIDATLPPAGSPPVGGGCSTDSTYINKCDFRGIYDLRVMQI